MKAIYRVVFVVAMISASMLGGYLANRLGPDRVQAAPSTAFGPPQKITLLNVPYASTNPAVFGTTAVKIADVGSFTVENSASLIEVTHQGMLYIWSTTGGGVYFELRVDDKNGIRSASNNPSGMSMIRWVDGDQYVPSTFSGFWTGLAAGSHTVSIWVRASYGQADTAIINPGGWASNLVIVKENMPFGSTYLPSIQK